MGGGGAALLNGFCLRGGGFGATVVSMAIKTNRGQARLLVGHWVRMGNTFKFGGFPTPYIQKKWFF